MGGSGDERRRKIRYQRRLPVRFGTDTKMGGGTVLDISEAGLRIQSAETFPVNAVILVFVQFPRHTVRLRARVVWGGSDKEGSGPTMGLTFTRPEPQLIKSHQEWCAEIKILSMQDADGDDAPSTDAEAPAPAAPGPAARDAGQPAGPPPAAAPRRPEPKSPVRRRLESRQGLTYDALFEKWPGGWELTIVQVPRQLGVDAPDFKDSFDDFGSAEDAFRAFVRDH
jgi:hypothetical protein